MSKAKKQRLARPEPPTPKRTDSQAIVDAVLIAGEELAVAGLDEVTMTAIADRAGVGVASVYRYFPDKAALFAELFRRQHEKVLDRLALDLASASSLEEVVRRVVEGFAGFDEEESRRRRALNMAVPPGWSAEELGRVLDRSLEVSFKGVRPFLPTLSEKALSDRIFYALALARGVVKMRMIRPNMAPPTEQIVEDLAKQIVQLLKT